MTHSLHRSGTRESLSTDYVIFAIAAQTVNAKGTAPQFKNFADIVLKYNPVNFGDMKTGNTYKVGEQEILANFRDNSIVHAVFTDAETVAAALAELKEANLDLSIVLSGIVEHTDKCCRDVDIVPHTTEVSLGIHGKTELLPKHSESLDITTMCGHGMLAFSLIEDLAKKMAAGRMDAKKASVELAKQCHCGIYNVTRGEELLTKLASKY